MFLRQFGNPNEVRELETQPRFIAFVPFLREN
jgi:hypothetical protein